jgi:hypothetical protein
MLLVGISEHSVTLLTELKPGTGPVEGLAARAFADRRVDRTDRTEDEVITDQGGQGTATTKGSDAQGSAWTAFVEQLREKRSSRP